MTLSHIDGELERLVLGKLIRAWIHVQIQAFATRWDFLDDGIIIEHLEGGGNSCYRHNFSFWIDLAHLERPETPDWLEHCFPGWVSSRFNLLPYMKSRNLLAVYGLFHFLLKDNFLIAYDDASFTCFSFLSDAHVLGYFLPLSVTLLTHLTLVIIIFDGSQTLLIIMSQGSDPLDFNHSSTDHHIER